MSDRCLRLAGRLRKARNPCDNSDYSAAAEQNERRDHVDPVPTDLAKARQVQDAKVGEKHRNRRANGGCAQRLTRHFAADETCDEIGKRTSRENDLKRQKAFEADHVRKAP